VAKKQINLTFCDLSHAKIELKATQAGISVSAWVRNQIELILSPPKSWGDLDKATRTAEWIKYKKAGAQIPEGFQDWPSNEKTKWMDHNLPLESTK
jgi:hypothetical protein